jgi:hypothetical protein
MRYQKEYPEVFRYLGWCSWEEYDMRISENSIRKDIEALKASPVPVRYVLIDDGHLKYEGTLDWNKGRQEKLSSFRPGDNFPNGFRPLTALKDDKIKWMGLWHNFNGSWKGYAQKNDFGERINSHLRLVKSTDTALPTRDPASIRTVFEALLLPPSREGMDFLKIDVQTMHLSMLRGSENAARQAYLSSRLVDEIGKNYYHNTIINCMAINNIVMLNAKYTPVTRLSIDYKLGELFMAKEHLLQSYQNSVWLGQTVWGDHDMFHSTDPVCGRVMALSKAISGGPVYLSDAPQKIDHQVVKPLCYGDGRLIRPLAPAGTLQRSVFCSPLTGKSITFPPRSTTAQQR